MSLIVTLSHWSVEVLTKLILSVKGQRKLQMDLLAYLFVVSQSLVKMCFQVESTLSDHAASKRHFITHLSVKVQIHHHITRHWERWLLEMCQMEECFTVSTHFLYHY